MHCWAALFAHLKEKEQIRPRNPEETKLFDYAYLKSFQYYQSLPPEFGEIPIPTGFGELRILSRAGYFDLLKKEAFEEYFSKKSPILVISPSAELADAKKNDYDFRCADSIEWLAQNVELAIGRRYNHHSLKPRIVVESANNQANSKLTERYARFLKQFLQAFFPHAEPMMEMSAAFKANPTCDEINALAAKMQVLFE